MSRYTSSFCNSQLNDISSKLIEFRGISDDEEIDYNGIKYKAGNLMDELRRDYKWWNTKYNKALIDEGNAVSSGMVEYKFAKGWE